MPNRNAFRDSEPVVHELDAWRKTRAMRMPTTKMIELVRQIIDSKSRLPATARTLAPNADLYEAGLSPFAAIQVMLALEEACGVEFPEHVLRRQNFSSLNSIVACLQRVERKAAQTSRGAYRSRGHERKYA